MPTFEDTYTTALAAAVSAVSELAQVQASAHSFDSFDDDQIVAILTSLADTRRTLDASSAMFAGVVDHRSRRELGHSGLAQREGYQTPAKLIQHLTGSTARDASTLVVVGAIMRDASASHPLFVNPAFVDPAPWLRAVGVAVSAGSLTVSAAEAIRNGLGQPSEHVSVAQLASAVESLLLESLLVNADQLFTHARDLRDALDASGVADREQRIREQRGVREINRSDGSTRIIIDTDLESGAYLRDLFDKMTSPRRGGPRFVAEDEQAWAEGVSEDPRTTSQLKHDGLVQLVRIGVTAETTDSRAIVGSRQPSVRVLVTADALRDGVGFGHLESTSRPGSGETASVTTVSIATVERLACADGTITIAFDASRDNAGQALNLGREQRLFSSRQRIALAARDGGCRWTDCDKPPSWTEAHHSQHWKADNGLTDVADGILLCRHHHMLLHNNHWDITRDGAQYWLTPPVDIDPTQTPRLLPSKSAALRDLLGVRSMQLG